MFTSALRVGAALALALIAYDAALHGTTLLTGRHANGFPLANLPWVLFPTFPTWATYDAVWAAIHALAFAALSLALLTARR